MSTPEIKALSTAKQEYPKVDAVYNTGDLHITTSDRVLFKVDWLIMLAAR